MNPHVQFSRQIFLNSVKAAGLDDKLAVTIADGLDQSLSDEIALKSDLKEVEATLTTKIDRVEASLTAKIDRVDAKIDRVENTLRGEMQIGFAGLKTEIANSQSTVLKLIIAQSGFFLALAAAIHFIK